MRQRSGGGHGGAARHSRARSTPPGGIRAPRRRCARRHAERRRDEDPRRGGPLRRPWRGPTRGPYVDAGARHTRRELRFTGDDRLLQRGALRRDRFTPTRGNLSRRTPSRPTHPRWCRTEWHITTGQCPRPTGCCTAFRAHIWPMGGSSGEATSTLWTATLSPRSGRRTFSGRSTGRTFPDTHPFEQGVDGLRALADRDRACPFRPSRRGVSRPQTGGGFEPFESAMRLGMLDVGGSAPAPPVVASSFMVQLCAGQ